MFYPPPHFVAVRSDPAVFLDPFYRYSLGFMIGIHKAKKKERKKIIINRRRFIARRRWRRTLLNRRFEWFFFENKFLYTLTVPPQVFTSNTVLTYSYK